MGDTLALQLARGPAIANKSEANDHIAVHVHYALPKAMPPLVYMYFKFCTLSPPNELSALSFGCSVTVGSFDVQPDVGHTSYGRAQILDSDWLIPLLLISVMGSIQRPSLTYIILSLVFVSPSWPLDILFTDSAIIMDHDLCCTLCCHNARTDSVRNGASAPVTKNSLASPRSSFVRSSSRPCASATSAMD